MPTDVELEPEPAEVLQAESVEVTAVKVEVEGLVRVQELPTKAATAVTRTVNATQGTKVLSADHRRKKAVIVSEDNIWIAYSKAGIQSAIDVPAQNQAFKLLGSVGLQFVVEAAVEIWVAAVSSTAVVSVAAESWATGEGAA